ncbi:hypothetical protein CDAR_559321 [Caerostris darwini]|uniref:Cyclin-like domain-containing protein n=1 Tax=Caerostris darwini TaxID=1538125 RepID=A0AAV4NZ73_9ARAC|nr:hypothetical protein CDAR_559321 [Caerostris darwini]
MELYCCESENVTRAYEDPLLNEDSRVFENLLVTEDRYVISSNYFKCVQSDLKPYMRTVVAEWMQEVCEEERCQDEVFPLAVNCLDRFLLMVRVDKSQLQLLGAVCLFLASKLRQSRPLTAERLCLYSDHSISVVQLISWELLVLNTLKWDLAAITPFDFVGHILKRLGITKGDKLIRRHAHTFIGLCTTGEYSPLVLISDAPKQKEKKVNSDVLGEGCAKNISKSTAGTGIQELVFESVVRSTNYEAHLGTSPPEVSASIDSGQVRSSARHGLNHRLSLALQITNVLTSGYI